MLRLFIAVDFPPEIIAKIAKINTYLQTQVPARSMKWVSPENLHLTLKFMGGVPENRLAELKSRLQETLQGQTSFTIAIEGMGMYPNANQPRVLWLGIRDPGDLGRLHHNLAHALQDFDPEPEKRSFSPHLTVARIRQTGDRDAIRRIGKTLSEFKVDTLGTLNIHAVHLYKSELTPQGPIYSALLSVPLNQV